MCCCFTRCKPICHNTARLRPSRYLLGMSENWLCLTPNWPPNQRSGAKCMPSKGRKAQTLQFPAQCKASPTPRTTSVWPNPIYRMMPSNRHSSHCVQSCEHVSRLDRHLQGLWCKSTKAPSTKGLTKTFGEFLDSPSVFGKIGGPPSNYFTALRCGILCPRQPRDKTELLRWRSLDLIALSAPSTEGLCSPVVTIELSTWIYSMQKIGTTVDTERSLLSWFCGPAAEDHKLTKASHESPIILAPALTRPFYYFLGSFLIDLLLNLSIDENTSLPITKIVSFCSWKNSDSLSSNRQKGLVKGSPKKPRHE